MSVPEDVIPPQERALRQALRAYQELRSRESYLRLERDEESMRAWGVALQERLLEAMARARQYESTCKLSPSERQALGRRGQSLAARRIGLYVLSGFVLVVASYPASISTATILGMPMVFVGGLKIAWLLWAWFILLVLVAELLLVSSIARLRWHHDVKANLQTAQALDETQRREGKRLILMDPAQQRTAQAWLVAQAGLAVVLILIDFMANTLFLISESEASLGISFWLPFAGFLSFLGIALLLGNIKYKEELVDTALSKASAPMTTNGRFSNFAQDGS